MGEPCRAGSVERTRMGCRVDRGTSRTGLDDGRQDQWCTDGRYERPPTTEVRDGPQTLRIVSPESGDHAPSTCGCGTLHRGPLPGAPRVVSYPGSLA